MRSKAAEALGKIGDNRAIEPLTTALKDKDNYVLKCIAKVLDSFEWQPDDSEKGAAYWVAKFDWDKCVDIGALAVKPLIITLKTDVEPSARSNAAEALGRIGDTRAIKPLTVALKDKNFSVKQSARKALEQIDTPKGKS